MLEFAEDLDECRKIQFAKFVCLLKSRIGGGDYRAEPEPLLSVDILPLIRHGRRKTPVHSILAVIVTIARGHQTPLNGRM